jgi:type II secretory pathway pseudopilin PulG
MDIAVITIIALAVGLALGWFLGSRPAAQWRAQAEARERDAREQAEVRDREMRELDARYLRTFADLEAARERAEPMRWARRSSRRGASTRTNSIGCGPPRLSLWRPCARNRGACWSGPVAN